MASKRYVFRALSVAATLYFLFLIARDGFRRPATVGLIMCLVAIVGLETLVLPFLDWLIARKERAARDAQLQEAVGAILNRIFGKDRVFRDVRAPIGHIDHLVFRDDGGIFVIETHTHRGKVTVDKGELRRDGRPFEKNLIKLTLDKAAWVKKMIALNFAFAPTWIRPAVVFTNSSVPEHCSVSNVAVLRPADLERWMAAQSGADPTGLHLRPWSAEMQRLFGQKSRS